MEPRNEVYFKHRSTAAGADPVTTYGSSNDDARHHLWEELVKRVMATPSPRGDPDARLA